MSSQTLLMKQRQVRLNTAHGKWKHLGYRKFGKRRPSLTWTKPTCMRKSPFQARLLVNVQETEFHPPPPPPPDSMLFSGSRTVSWQAAIPTSTLHKGEGGGGNKKGRN